MNIPAAIVQVLLGQTDVSSIEVSALVGVRVFTPELPEAENDFMPNNCVVVSSSGGGSLGPGARSFASWRVNRMDVLSYGKDTYQALQVSGAVDEIITQLAQVSVPAVDTLLKNAVISGGPIQNRTFPLINRGPHWPTVLTVYDVHATPLS